MRLFHNLGWMSQLLDSTCGSYPVKTLLGSLGKQEGEGEVNGKEDDHANGSVFYPRPDSLIGVDGDLV